MMSVLKGKSISPRDERGCVTEEVVENLVVVDEDTIPCYAVGPYLRICEYLSKGISNTIKRAWQVPPRVAKPLTPLVAPRSGLVQIQGGGKAVISPHQISLGTGDQGMPLTLKVFPVT